MKYVYGLNILFFFMIKWLFFNKGWGVIDSVFGLFEIK